MNSASRKWTLVLVFALTLAGTLCAQAQVSDPNLLFGYDWDGQTVANPSIWGQFWSPGSFEGNLWEAPVADGVVTYTYADSNLATGLYWDTNDWLSSGYDSTVNMPESGDVYLVMKYRANVTGTDDGTWRCDLITYNDTTGWSDPRHLMFFCPAPTTELETIIVNITNPADTDPNTTNGQGFWTGIYPAEEPMQNGLNFIGLNTNADPSVTNVVGGDTFELDYFALTTDYAPYLDGGEPTDTDGDGLDDSVETNTGTYVSPDDTGTDPNNPDSDGDGYSDGEEVATGSDPLDPQSVPPDTGDMPIAGGAGLAILTGAFALLIVRNRNTM